MTDRTHEPPPAAAPESGQPDGYTAALRLAYALDAIGVEVAGAKGANVDGRAVTSVFLLPDAAACLALHLAPQLITAKPPTSDPAATEGPFDTGLADALREAGLDGLQVESAPARIGWTEELRLRGEPAAVEQLAAMVEGLA